MPTVIEILKQHLVDNGFDGLLSDAECGCELSNLQPCGEDFAGCKPGYKGAAKDPSFDFYIYESKEDADKSNNEPDDSEDIARKDEEWFFDDRDQES